MAGNIIEQDAPDSNAVPMGKKDISLGAKSDHLFSLLPSTLHACNADLLRTAKRDPRPAPAPFFLPLNIAFSLCLLSHLFAAVYAPIQDCDEVFNYWEPMHYLNHGYGLQTWEYSPEFALRSWFYIVIHAIPTKIIQILARSKRLEFYLLRILLAVICAATETRLFAVLSRTLNPRIGVIYLMIVASSPGVFYASVAFLPSSFAMYTSNLGLAAFMDWRRGPKTAIGIMWFGIGAVVGWPFSVILATPFLLEEIVICMVTGEAYDTFRRFLDGIVRSLIPLVKVSWNVPGNWLTLAGNSIWSRPFLLP